MSPSKEPFEKAAELLLKGATMLHIACPVCSDPIYRLS
ncbi:MAG: Sjogren's syndrome/scleroderma autoantigen 1 family protein, partial [Candidatus Kariarchaeaceae archaeon]